MSNEIKKKFNFFCFDNFFDFYFSRRILDAARERSI